MTVQELLEEEANIPRNYFNRVIIYFGDQDPWSDGEFFKGNSESLEGFVNDDNANLLEKYGTFEVDDNYYDVWDADDGPADVVDEAWLYIHIIKNS